MASGLIGLLVVVIVVGIVAWLIIYCLDLLPMDARFKSIARVLIFVIAILVILFHALPLLSVSVAASLCPEGQIRVILNSAQPVCIPRPRW